MRMFLSTILLKAHIIILILISLYILSLLSLTQPTIQRHVLYSHKVKAWWRDVNKPEQHGFAKNQVTPFNFTTSDNEVLHAWHILPLGLYAAHEGDLLKEPAGIAEDVTKTTAFRLLRDDSQAKLVISFHGNAGDVTQGWRTDSYRALSDGSTSSIHILTFDYRGFGHSSGTPTEEGLIEDGIAAVEWAMQVAKVPTRNIVILGQSLGTAVSAAVAEHFAERGIEFAGLILVAGFTNLPSLLMTYSIGGYLPVLSPLRAFPQLYNKFVYYLADTWQTTTRLANFVRKSQRLRLYLLHALDDFEIPWTQCEGLFAVAANATIDGGIEIGLLEKMKARSTIQMGDGAFISSWNTGNDKIIREQIVAYGTHSRVMTYAPVALAVLKAFELDNVDNSRE